ncbi:MAG: helix-turn-helix transcriptional regulator [Oscillospiraceae bacterium]|nr:helix-turn-helix transcriptional regulator [Oscillospiraceae bacterium]
MGTSESNNFVIAKRLRALRNQKGLSYEALRTGLAEKCGITISVDSLKNYEVITPYTKRSSNNLGMGVKYLQALADFYGVSTDYLLGRTNAPAMRPTAVDDLGFSPEVIRWLSGFRQSSEPDEFEYISHEGLLQTANSLFENSDFQDLVSVLCDLIDGAEAESIYHSLPADFDRSDDVEKIAHSGKYREPVIDWLYAQDNLCGYDCVSLPGKHPFGINVTDILNNDVNSAVSRLVDSLRRRKE